MNRVGNTGNLYPAPSCFNETLNGMKFYFSIIIISFIYCTAFSCNQNVTRLNDYLSDYNDIIGREINWNDISFHVWPSSFGMSNIKGYKMISLIGSSCLTCIEKINQWNEFLKTNKFQEAQILFIAVGPPSEDLTHYLNETNELSIPVLIDSSEKFIEKNNLQTYYQSTFLLDENNKVIMIGDPLKHENVYDYYRHILTRN